MIMPSGSHGGSSGSHFGGGSSGGSHFGGGSSGGQFSNRTTPIHWVWHGHSYYIPVSSGSSIQAWFVAIFVMLFIAILSAVPLFHSNSVINKIQVDRNYYIHMIEKAEQNENYKKEGTIKDIFYNEDCGKWYFTYEIAYDDGVLEGYTYSVYSESEIYEFEIGQTLYFAVNNPNVNADTDSINMEYKNIPLEADGEYINAKRNIAVCSVLLAVFGSLTIILTIVAIRRLKKVIMKSQDTSNLTEEEKKKTCVYCGTMFKDGETKCSSCGASRKE